MVAIAVVVYVGFCISSAGSSNNGGDSGSGNVGGRRKRSSRNRGRQSTHVPKFYELIY